MKRKKYTELTTHQVEAKELCIENATKNLSRLQELEITNESLYEFSGVLVFFMRIKAKPDTGMLFICDKTYHVEIGRLGGVRSYQLDTKSPVDNPWKRNKYKIF